MSDALHSVHWRHIKPVNRENEIKKLKSQVYVANPHRFSTMDRYIKHVKKIKKTNDLIQSAGGMPERWHALVDISTGKKIKHHAMSSRDAYDRNKTIKDLGMAWVLCEK